LLEYGGKIGALHERRLLKYKGSGPIGVERVCAQTSPDSPSRGEMRLLVGISLREWLAIRARLRVLARRA
jgi:hypothetical protein